MRRRLSQILRCPVDRGPLELVAWTSESRALDAADREKAARLQIPVEALEEDVVEGVLVSGQKRVYPIMGGVPRMLPFATGMAADFVSRHRKQLEEDVPGYRMPSQAAPPGEEEVLRTFSSEWEGYDWTGDSYWNLTPDAWFRCMDWVLSVQERPAGSLVLEVGMGVGGVADHNTRSLDAEVVGMDLGQAVDVANRHFGGNPFLHVVQGSAFTPPFAPSTFDFVYSFGVLHHTYSTRTALDSVASLPKPGGRLYVWVYSPYHERRTPVRRALMAFERVVRPVVSRLPETLQTVALAPVVPLYVAHQGLRVVRGEPGQVHYGWREALHAARDRLTPRYIHRHSDEEMSGWFSELGFDQLVCTSERERPEWVPLAFTVCTGVDGVRGQD